MQLYQKQGLKVAPKNEVLQKIMEVTGLAENTVGTYLAPNYKQIQMAREQKPRITASERVENALGKDVVDKLREELKAEERRPSKEWRLS